MLKKLVIIFVIFFLITSCQKFSRDQFIGQWKIVEAKISDTTDLDDALDSLAYNVAGFLAKMFFSNIRLDFEQDSVNIIFSKMLGLEQKFYWTVENDNLLFVNDSDTILFKINSVDKELIKLKYIISPEDSSYIDLILLREQY